MYHRIDPNNQTETGEKRNKARRRLNCGAVYKAEVCVPFPGLRRRAARCRRSASYRGKETVGFPWGRGDEPTVGNTCRGSRRITDELLGTVERGCHGDRGIMANPWGSHETVRMKPWDQVRAADSGTEEEQAQGINKGVSFSLFRFLTQENKDVRTIYHWFSKHNIT